MLNDYRIAPANGGAPGRVIIFLHGVGDSGTGGLLEIGRLWQGAFPDAEFLCPDAPFPFELAPVGRQWFGLTDFSPPAMLKGAQGATPHLNAYIDHVLESRKLTPDKVALVGFSQGTMVALYAALRREKAVAGILGYSGILLGGEKLALEKKCAPPVLLIHGMMDEVVPYSSMAMSEELLRRGGIPVSSITCPHVGHSIDERGLQEGLKFLRKIFS